MDFIDHILQFMGIPKTFNDSKLDELKIRIETVLALAVTEYTFSYLNPSILAASAIHLVLSRFNKMEYFAIDQRLCNAIGGIQVSFLLSIRYDLQQKSTSVTIDIFSRDFQASHTDPE